MLSTPSTRVRRRGGGDGRRRPIQRRRLAAAALGVLMLGGALSACSDGDSGRRFANDPIPTLPLPTATATLDPDRPATPSVGGVGEPDQSAPSGPLALLDARGAPRRLYFLVDGSLWTIGAAGDDPRPIYSPPAGATIRAIATAPGVKADEVALLVGEPAPVDATPAASPVATPVPSSPEAAAPAETTTLLVLDPAGGEIRRLAALERSLDPAATGGQSPRAIALTWPPQGGRLLAAFDPGGVVTVPPGGEPALLVPGDVGQALTAAWSPAGDAVAVVATDPVTGRAKLLVSRVADGAAGPPLEVAPGTASADVTATAWLPDGSGLLYAEAESGSAAGSGDLFFVASDGTQRRLVASTGRAAPVARVLAIAVAPDGRAVAYTVGIPDPTGIGTLFHSLWLQDLKAGGKATRLPAKPGGFVTDLWWTDGGLVWRSGTIGTSSPDEKSFVLERLDASGVPLTIFVHEPTTATPAASPVASPVASPDAVATPVP
jgi:hypothetical protein